MEGKKYTNRRECSREEKGGILSEGKVTSEWDDMGGFQAMKLSHFECRFLEKSMT